MQILLITHHYEPEIGAPQRRWSALVSRLQRDGHQVTVYCPSPHYPDRESTVKLRETSNRPLRRERGRFGETLVRMPYVVHGFSGWIRAVDQVVTAGFTVLFASAEGVLRRGGYRFDAVVSTVPGVPSLFAGVVVSKLLRIPHIAEMRDAWPDVVTGALEDQVRDIALHRLALKSLVHRVVTAGQRSADAVVTTTEEFAQRLRRRRVQQVVAIPNGADSLCFESIEPLTPGFHDARGSAELRVQYLGTVGRSQGLIVLIRALEILKLRDCQLQVRARIVGSGAEVEWLKRESAACGVCVEFVPPISRQRLCEAYRWADVELVSLRRTRPFRWTVPSKIFELLVTRRRLIALVEGSAAELVRTSGVGTVIPPEDASALADELERLAKNPDLLCVGSSGIDLVHEKYSYEAMKSRYEILLSYVFARGSNGVCGEPKA